MLHLPDCLCDRTLRIPAGGAASLSVTSLCLSPGPYLASFNASAEAFPALGWVESCGSLPWLWHPMEPDSEQGPQACQGGWTTWSCLALACPWLHWTTPSLQAFSAPPKGKGLISDHELTLMWGLPNLSPFFRKCTYANETGYCAWTKGAGTPSSP